MAENVLCERVRQSNLETHMREMIVTAIVTASRQEREFVCTPCDVRIKVSIYPKKRRKGKK